MNPITTSAILHNDREFPLIGCYGFELQHKGHKIQVNYNYSPFKDPTDESLNYFKEKPIEYASPIHFEFFGNAISETAYKSHFTYASQIKINPETFARWAVEMLYNEMKAKHPEALEIKSQLCLF